MYMFKGYINNYIVKILLGVLFLLCGILTTHAQFFNKEIKGEILVKRNSEFYTFGAAATNITPVDYNLRYEFSVFRTDGNNNTSKNSQGDLFFLKGNEKKLLSTVTINYNLEGKIVILLLIYDIDGKPVGKDRIVLEDGGKSIIDLNRNRSKEPKSKDIAAADDGVEIDGLVLQKTLTKSGRDFYRYFYNEYYNRQILAPSNILIKEVPGRRRNTLITVEVGDQLVWQFFAQPRRDFLVDMANVALQRTLGHLNRLKQQNEEFIRY